MAIQIETLSGTTYYVRYHTDGGQHVGIMLAVAIPQEGAFSSDSVASPDLQAAVIGALADLVSTEITDLGETLDSVAVTKWTVDESDATP